MSQDEATLPFHIVVAVRVFSALVAVALFFSPADWAALKPMSLPPAAMTIAIMGAVISIGVSSLAISIHEHVLRLLRQKPEITAPILRWIVLAMTLAGAIPAVRFGLAAYWVLAAAIAIAGAITVVMVQRTLARRRACVP